MRRLANRPSVPKTARSPANRTLTPTPLLAAFGCLPESPQYLLRLGRMTNPQRCRDAVGPTCCRCGGYRGRDLVREWIPPQCRRADRPHWHATGGAMNRRRYPAGTDSLRPRARWLPMSALAVPIALGRRMVNLRRPATRRTLHSGIPPWSRGSAGVPAAASSQTWCARQRHRILMHYPRQLERMTHLQGCPESVRATCCRQGGSDGRALVQEQMRLHCWRVDHPHSPRTSDTRELRHRQASTDSTRLRSADYQSIAAAAASVSRDR